MEMGAALSLPENRSCVNSGKCDLRSTPNLQDQTQKPEFPRKVRAQNSSEQEGSKA